MNIDKIKIYSNANCPYCKEVKKKLEENNIEFENIDTIENRDKWAKVSEFTGMPNVPTIHYKNRYLCPGRDYGNPTHLVNQLNNFYEQEEITLDFLNERIKTLNYNMSTAFGRLDQLLRQIETKINKDESKN